MSDQIHYGSCLDSNMYPKELVDLIIFDPPFWPFSKQYSQIERSACGKPKNILADIPTPDKKHYAEWWDSLCQILQNKLKPKGWFCYKSDSWGAKLTFPITTKYFDYSNEVIWEKDNIGLGRYIRTKHESIQVYFAKGGTRKNWKYKTVMDIKAGKGQIGPAFPSVLHISAKLSERHINETPKELWYKFIDYMCPKSGLVLDPTAGTGSIEKACRILGRQYWGIEIESPEMKNKANNQSSISNWIKLNAK